MEPRLKARRSYNECKPIIHTLNFTISDTWGLFCSLLQVYHFIILSVLFCSSQLYSRSYSSPPSNFWSWTVAFVTAILRVYISSEANEQVRALTSSRSRILKGEDALAGPAGSREGLTDWVVVLRHTRQKIGHFGDVPQTNLLAWYGSQRRDAWHEI